MDTRVAESILQLSAASGRGHDPTHTHTFGNGTDVLVEARDESDMTRAGFCGNACVRHTPGTPLFYHTPGKHIEEHNLLKKKILLKS